HPSATPGDRARRHAVRHRRRFSRAPTGRPVRHARRSASSRGHGPPVRCGHSCQPPRAQAGREAKGWPLPAPVGPRLTGLKHKPRRTTTMPNDDLARARAESAALLNLDPDKLSPTDALKCELVSALRLVVDDELARATSGNGADLGKLIVAVCRGRTPDRAHA